MGVGIRSVAYCVPPEVRRNSYWHEHYPELVAKADEKNLASVWKCREADVPNVFDRAMEPYLADPFRGAVERRILGEHELSRSMEVGAARAALKAAHFGPSEVDLVLVSSFLPDQHGPGNAAYVVRDLGMRCPAINVESACASALVSLNTAVGLVRSGQYRNALVVTSCTYSRIAPEHDTISWFMGDGAGAILVGEVPDDRGWVAQHTVSTSSSCGTFRVDLVVDPALGPVQRIAASKETARVLNESGEPLMREACTGALARAGIGVEDVACFVVNTPTAWYADFACQVMNIDRAKALSTYERFANTGTALTPINLHESARTGMMKDGDWVLMYAVGSVSTAVATVLRWNDVALGHVD